MNPNPVTLDARFLDIGPYDVSEFEPLLEYQGRAARETRRAVGSNLLTLPPRPLHLDGHASDLSFPDVFPPSDANAIADECAQLGHMRATRGIMPEPVWYACIGILAFCDEEGQMRAHEWSRGDRRYSRRSTA